MQTDAELLARWAATADPTAFAELARRHGAFVFRVCLRQLGDAHEAEDAAQAVFLVLARSAHKIRKGVDLAAWLYTVSLRVSREAGRGKMRRRRHEEDGAMMRIRENVLPISEAEGREALGLIYEELAHLSAPQRQALILLYLEGRSQREAAQIAGCPVGTLGWRASQGIARLRKRLALRGSVLGALVLIGVLEAEANAVAPMTLLPSLLAVPKAVLGGAAAGTAGSKVAVLAEGAMKAMFWAKAKVLAVVVAAAVTASGAVGMGLHGQLAPGQSSSRAGERQQSPSAKLTALPIPGPKAPVWRNIGPGGGGWLPAVAVCPQNSRIVYIGCDVGSVPILVEI